MNSKLSFSLLALKNFDELENLLKILKKKKIKFVELPLARLLPNYRLNKKKIFTFKNLLKKYKIKVSATQGIFFNKKLNVFNKSHIKKNVDHLKKIIHLSKLLGSKLIIFGSPLNRKITKDPKHKDFEISNFIILLKKIEKILIKNKIFFLLEPNSKFYNCNFIINSNDGIKFIRNARIKNLFLNIDIGNAILENDNLNFKNYEKKLIKNIQISEKNLSELKLIDIKKYLILRKVLNRNIKISLEMLNIKTENIEKNILIFKKIVSNAKN